MAYQSKAAEIWRERLDRFEASGLSVKEFCVRESVSNPSFYQWRKKLADAGRNGQQRTRPNAMSAFQPVRVTPVAEVLSIEFPGGARLCVPTSNLDLARAVTREVAMASRLDDAGAP
jgi:hypothetical protein